MGPAGWVGQGLDLSQSTGGRNQLGVGRLIYSERRRRREIVETPGKLGHLTVICADGHTLTGFLCDKKTRSPANTEGLG